MNPAQLNRRRSLSKVRAPFYGSTYPHRSEALTLVLLLIMLLSGYDASRLSIPIQCWQASWYSWRLDHCELV